MRIIAIRPEPPGGYSTVVARFDAQITDDVALYGLALKRGPDGNFKAGAPNLRGARSAIFSTSFRDHLTAAAVEALNNGGQPPREPLASH